MNVSLAKPSLNSVLEGNMTIRYELIIYWSDEDQSFIVEVPELPSCTADGETYQQAVQTLLEGKFP